MKIRIRKYLQYVFLLVLFLGAIQQSFALNLGELRSEKVELFRSVETDLVKSWELAFNCPTVVRTNTSILESISTAIQRGVKEVSEVLDNVNIPEINLNTVEHIFRGSPNNGVHHISALIARTDIQLVNRVPTSQGCYKATVKFPNGQTKPKDFFPDEWDEIKTIQEVETAFGNKVPKPEWGSGQFLGTSSEGIPIRIQVANGKVTSAYPYFD